MEISKAIEQTLHVISSWPVFLGDLTYSQSAHNEGIHMATVFSLYVVLQRSSPVPAFHYSQISWIFHTCLVCYEHDQIMGLRIYVT